MFFKTYAFSILFLAAFLVYSNSLHAPFILDDLHAIANNESIKTINFHPKSFMGTRTIPYFTFQLNYAINQYTVTGYHLVNVLIHALNAFLVFLIVFYLSTDIKTCLKLYSATISTRLALAFFAGMLFTVHPLLSQTVIYSVQRMVLLSSFFYLTSLLTYILSRKTKSSLPCLLWYGCSLIAAILAMHCKEISFTLPVALILVEYFFLSKNIVPTLRQLLKILPFVIIALIIPAYMLGVVELYFTSNPEPYKDQITEIVTAGRINVVAAETDKVSRLHYLYTQFGVIVTYMRLSFFPLGLNIDHHAPLQNNLLSVQVIGPLILLLVWVLFAVKLMMWKYRFASFGMVFFLLALSIESSIIPITDTIFEHRAYLPFVGIVFIFLDLLHFLMQKYRNQYLFNLPIINIIFVICLVLLFSLALATHARAALWEEPLAIWTDAVSKSPNKSRPLNNLGLVYMENKNYTDAEIMFRRALDNDPDNPEVMTNLGSLYGQTKQASKAIEILTRAIAINPKQTSAYVNLGNTHLQRHNYQQALEAYSQALSHQPQSAETWASLGDAYIGQNDYMQAINAYLTATRINNANPNWFNRLGALYAMTGSFTEAENFLQKALSLDPNLVEAKNNLNKLRAEENAR